MDKRRLPWRPEPGERPDPYRVWLSEVMLQQTTVAHALPYFDRFIARWPTVLDLAAAEDGEVMAAWAGLGYYARARNLLACARTVAVQNDGLFPSEEADLRRLPGIGDYTAAAIAAIAFGRPAMAVDANVERITARLFAVETPLPSARLRIRALAANLLPHDRPGEFIQAMMSLGQTLCTPRNPECPRCPLIRHCAASRTGEPSSYPRKTPKRARPKRSSTAFWLEHDGHVLLERRPPSGLLGGMLALPETAPAEAQWSRAGAVDHVFTHFALNMNLLCAEASERTEGLWWPVDRISEAGLPTLFAKLAQRAVDWRAMTPLTPLPIGERQGPNAQRWEGEGRVREGVSE